MSEYGDSKPEPFNRLTPAQAERLDVLQEECAEVILAISKIKRHGYESCKAFNHGAATPEELALAETNRQALERELGDFLHALQRLINKCEVDRNRIMDWSQNVELAAKCLRYLHHQ